MSGLFAEKPSMKSQIIVFIWFLALSVPLAYMMGIHTVPMKESHSPNLVKIKSQELIVYHFLGADCGCSESVVKSFFKRSPSRQYREKIFVLGSNEAWVKELKRKGYQVESESMDYYEKKFEIVAVPQLVAVKNGKILYSGGYSAKRNPSSEDVEDKKILGDLVKTHERNAYPVFGCINGTKNRKKADPMSVKYE